ncbi:tyrosine-type recombinase/integrase [Bacillus altitudinis]|uniref:tyrosine-type recombinase/integrase n=1 Tax=Bacillus altitudinis TaxID=293387 RepID=UPI00040A9DE3|nr:tyrosine-type recombinase/integrase [Bacillus altitudinis]MDR4198287.1 tyrosine-type recombinase/integrase [Bacillus altitudinis]
MLDDLDLQLDNFMLYCDSKNLAIKTKASYEQTLHLFLAYLREEHKIDEPKNIKTVHIRSYIKYLRERGKYTVVARESSKTLNNPHNRTDHSKPLSDTTIANYLRNIKVFFSFLLSEGEIRDNPVKNVQRIKPNRKKKKLLSEEDLRLFFRAFDTATFCGYRNWMQARLLLDTGMRVGELVNLRLEDIDFRRKTILLSDPKNGKQRFAFMSLKTMRDIKRWLRYLERYTNSEYIFPTNRGGKQSITGVEKNFTIASNKVGLSVAPHHLRNNFAKYYLLNGGDITTLSTILGHSSAEVTRQAYLDFDDDEVGRIYQKHAPLNNMRI